jgi:hypothetical protein
MKTGKIDVSRLSNPPLKSEFLTAKILARRGDDIKFLEPNRAKGSKTPDILMHGRHWEIKCPKGAGKYNLQHAFKTAVKQSENIVFNLYRMPGNEENNIRKLEKMFKSSSSAKHMIVIKKSRKIIDF